MVTSEYKDLFVEEAREHLQTINQSLLDFEEDPSNKEALNQIFRAAHTIKGMAATMNYDKIQKLSHKTEDALDLIRNGKIEVDSNIVDLIFSCFDGIEAMVEDIATKDTTDFDIEELIEQLDELIETASTGERKAKPKTEVREEKIEELKLDKKVEKKLTQQLKSGKNVYKIHVTLADTCMMKSIRAFLLIKKLNDDGAIAYSMPDLRAIENGEFDKGFDLYYITQEDKEEVEQILNSVSEIETKQVYPIEYSSSGKLQIVIPAEEEKTTLKETKTVATTQTVETTKTTTAPKTVQTIRISMDQLDHFMNLIGELVISKGRLAQIAQEHKLDDLAETIGTVDRLTTELQDRIMMIRMIPMKHIFNRFPRMVRDLAKQKGKKIELNIEGEGIEIDRMVLEEIGDPLVHLLRNAVDHGVETPEERKKKGKPETGRIDLIAERTRNHVLITVRDDGKGIDPNMLRRAAVEKGLKTQEEVDAMDDKAVLDLIWLPGFSSAKEITNISGRGVGMDVVKATIEKLNGTIDFTTEVDKGTTFTLRLPLTMAIFKSLFVQSGNETYAIPISNIIETIKLDKKDIKTIKGKKTTVLRDNVLPLVSLRELLDIKESEGREEEDSYAVVIQKDDKKIGLMVDRLIGEQEITIKNISGFPKKTKGIAGVTITGDGRVIIVLDVNTLID